jgi:hypothetical protein
MSSKQMTLIRGVMVNDLLEINQQVQDGIDSQELGFTIDQAVAVKQAIQDTTVGVLHVIDKHAQIFPAGHDLGSNPFFNESELAEAYIEAINS